MRKIASWLASLTITVMSIILTAVIVNFASKVIYNSEDFQKTHRNGIRVVDYVLKQRPDIYGDDSEIIPHPYLLYTNRPVLLGKVSFSMTRVGIELSRSPTDPSVTYQRKSSFLADRRHTVTPISQILPIRGLGFCRSY